MTQAERSDIARKGAQARMQLPDWPAHQSAAGKARAAKGDMSAVGRRGYETSVGKYGPVGWLERSAKTRRDRPSNLERHVAHILNSMGVAYNQEHIALTDSQQPLVVDFAIIGSRKVVEVHGRCHTEPGLNGGDPRGREKRDEARFIRLRAAGYEVCVIDHRLIDRAESALRAFLAM